MADGEPSARLPTKKISPSNGETTLAMAKLERIPYGPVCPNPDSCPVSGQIFGSRRAQPTIDNRGAPA